MNTTARRCSFIWILAVALCSGAAALGHQLLWTRRMVDLLGASGESLSRVVGVFFLGLALGAALAARVVERVRYPWRVLAWVESLVILACLPMVLLPQWTQWIWPALGVDGLLSIWGSWLKLFLSLLLVLPPAFGMGFFLPLAAKGMLSGNGHLGREGNWLYAANTLGGVFGLVLVTILLLPGFGAIGAILWVFALNLLVVAGCGWLHCWCGGETRASPKVMKTEHTPPDRNWWRPVLSFSFFSGWSLLAWEMLTIEMVSLVAPISFFVTSSILTCIILLLALGAWLVPFLQERGWNLVGSLRGVLMVSGLLALFTPPWFYLVSSKIGILSPTETPTGFFLKVTIYALLVCAPLFLIAGMVFPLITAILEERSGDRGKRSWGWILAVNGLGGLVGTEMAYGFLMPGLGLYYSFGVVGLCSLLAYPLLCPRQEQTSRLWNYFWFGGFGLTALLWMMLYPRIPLINPHTGLSLVEHRTGREGSVAVVEGPNIGTAIIMRNQYILGSSGARYDQERQGLLPLLLHPAPGHVTYIGLATGSSPGGGLLHPAVERLTAIELSPLVTRFAEAYFGDWNNGLFTDPRVRIVIEDGRTVLAAMDATEDVIVGDLFLPWGPGEGRLYSREHFQAVRHALRPGGIFCQWLPLYQLTEEQLEWIENTFSSVFPHYIRVVNDFNGVTPVLGLVGLRGETWPWEAIQAAWKDFAQSGAVDYPSLLIEDLWAAHLLDGGSAIAGRTGKVNTLNNLLVEVDAGRERVTGTPAVKYLWVSAGWTSWGWTVGR